MVIERDGVRYSRNISCLKKARSDFGVLRARCREGGGEVIDADFQARCHGEDNGVNLHGMM